MNFVRAFKLLSLTSVFLGTVSLHAGVNVNNGNFYIAYTDFLFTTPGLTIDVTRTYNSRSAYVRGAFGVGWSSEYEGYLKFQPKSVIFYEGGGGNMIEFKSAGKDTWTNGQFGNQQIKKLGKGYLLSTVLGKELLFNDKGALQRIADKNKNFINLVYDRGMLVGLKDNFNNQVKISWGEFGKIPRITAIEKGELKARYQYDDKGNLVGASGTDALPYKYSYDNEHNLTKISYKDGSYKEMGYNKVKDWVTKFRDKDGTVTTYDYISDNLDPENKFGTVVSQKIAGGPKEESKFWYEFRRRADGSKYNYRSASWIQGNVTETVFTECCGTPLVISQWKGVAPKSGERVDAWTNPPSTAAQSRTQFEYYADGLLKKKISPDGTTTALTYDAKFKKVSSVQQGTRKITYTYDDRGNLAWAMDMAAKKRLDLSYDLKGRLNTVKETVSTAKTPAVRFVYFRYNADGKPIEIKEKSPDGKEGVLRISYGGDGLVAGIFGGSGREVASDSDVQTAQKVAATFQGLLDIVQPAGVSLSPEG